MITIENENEGINAFIILNKIEEEISNKAHKRHSDQLDSKSPNSVSINRKNILDLFEKLKTIEDKEKINEKSSVQMKKIILRKSETINKGKYGNCSANRSENKKEPVVENYYDSNYNSLVCFICDLLISKDKLIKPVSCNHNFCDKCGKSFCPSYLLLL